MIGSATTSDFDQAKFAELVLYIAHSCRNDERFGSVKLSKILYYCDFEGFKRLLKPITGATYLKKPKGPFPAELRRTRRSLIAEGKAETILERVIDYHENRLVPTSGHVELSDKFSSVEREIIDGVIEKMRPMNAAEITEYSHGEFGWQHAELDEPIANATALIARDDAPWVVEYLAERNAA
ncbi:MAG: Panacea domain-containing protein [Chloroflexi bacterium]|nr:Panacea domain-containing protein [Chloroflexota bacterium]